jgi:hypothetical protein
MQQLRVCYYQLAFEDFLSLLASTVVDTFATVRGMFEQLKAEYQALATTFPADEYYRYGCHRCI